MRRRDFLGASAALTTRWLVDGPGITRLLAQESCATAEPEGELLGTVPLTGDRPQPTTFGRAVGGPGLDTRLFTDLSTLEPQRMITPTSEVFVRTAAPAGMAARVADWTIALEGGPARRRLTLPELRSAVRPMGAHLIECAGNNNPDNFGLLSAAEWSGVPLADVVEQMGGRRGAYGVLVTGDDDESQQARTSQPGAAWVLSWQDLDTQRPFLAVEMNGGPLPLDHGAPVRLVVPGWYGCSWMKWVRELRLVDADAPATTQMLEFAGRTHQLRRPELARDYEAPAIDLAATPVRVERRRVNGSVEYRVVGIVWGGRAPSPELLIRFDARDKWRPIVVCPARSPATWALWSYRWKPTEPGTYSISLKAADPSVRTRRLDMFFYTRRVRIDAG